jgi:hypothetical protein
MKKLILNNQAKWSKKTLGKIIGVIVDEAGVAEVVVVSEEIKKIEKPIISPKKNHKFKCNKLSSNRASLWIKMLGRARSAQVEAGATLICLSLLKQNKKSSKLKSQLKSHKNPSIKSLKR